MSDNNIIHKLRVLVFICIFILIVPPTPDVFNCIFSVKHFSAAIRCRCSKPEQTCPHHCQKFEHGVLRWLHVPCLKIAVRYNGLQIVFCRIVL